MQSKKNFTLILSLILICSCFLLCGFKFWGKNANKTQNDVMSVEQKFEKPADDLWCVTFQLVWNQFMDTIAGGNPIKFVGGNPKIADELNKKEYTKEIISPDSYYIEQGKISKDLKEKITKEIKRRFNEKSDIVDLINWNAKDSYLFYAMLKKNFKFFYAFDSLLSDSFNGSEVKVKYFGINENSDKKIRDNVSVLFYDSPNEYAVKLMTKENESLLLYRTDKKKSFQKLFDKISKNSKFDKFTVNDTLKIPYLVVDKTISYNDLTGKQVVNTEFVISQALQTIKFNLDEKGGSLKSEAAIAIMRTALLPEPEIKRDFNFDKPFVLFLIEEGKDKPYFAINVNSLEYIVKD